MPVSSLEKGVDAGLLTKRTIKGTDYYVATDGSKTVFLPSKVFDDAAASQSYAEEGRSVLSSMKPAEKVVIHRDPAPLPPSTEVQATTEAIGGAGKAGLGLFIVYQSAPATYEDILRVSDAGNRSHPGGRFSVN